MLVRLVFEITESDNDLFVFIFKKEKDIESSNKSTSSNNTNTSYMNSLGLTMEGKNGIYMAIIKGTLAEPVAGGKDEQILLRKNYQNLEDLICHTMAYDDYDSHYLKLAKLNRLKVLMELCMKIVGRPFNDISHEERTNLELEANRFHTTYPLPGEEVLLQEVKFLKIPFFNLKNIFLF